MFKNISKACFLSLALFFNAPGIAIAGEVNTGASGNVAIWGFDPVAYFTESRPVQGSKDIAFEWLGAEWHFANEEHRAMFSADPVRYAPQYGGHCAAGISGGVASNIDPGAWRIIDDKLYLFGNRDVMFNFLEKRGKLERSKERWPGIKKKLQNDSD